MFTREAMLERVRGRRDPWDLLVVGGGATGVGTAVDAASRGYAVLLLEQSDFGKGTSSRSTKLVHGGVRYLGQGNVPLVVEALRERETLRRNAPHLVHDLEFVVPCYRRWQAAFYGLGMGVYDALAPRRGFARSRLVSRAEVVARVPNVETRDLLGGVAYHDGQFDDARLLLHLARTAAEQGATLANYVRVTALRKDARGRVTGAAATDEETGEEHEVEARCVVNATGPFADTVRRLDDPGVGPLIAPSQGVHVVLDRRFLRGDSALLVPRTEDGRVLFVIPWAGRALVGTTDTPVDEPVLEPRAREEEIDFLLRGAGRYLADDPRPEDLRSVFTGIRPLVRGPASTRSAVLPRDHTIRVSPSGLVTIAGGKWTTYRRMAQDVVDRGAIVAGLPRRRCTTQRLAIHGHDLDAERHGRLAPHGTDAPAVARLIASGAECAQPLHARLDARVGDVVWAAREEMARTVDDVLARRTRSLSLDARAALEAAPRVAEVLARETGRDEAWRRAQVETFAEIASRALPPARPSS